MKAWLREYVTRVGGMIVAPRATLEALLDGEIRGGLLDLVLLAVLQLVATRLMDVVAHVFFIVDVSVSNGLLMLGNFLARGLFIPVVGTLLGAFIVSTGTSRPMFGARDGERDGERAAKPSDLVPALDIAALCALPGVAFQTLAALVVRLGGPVPPRNAVPAAAAVWFIGLALLARHIVKERGGGSQS